MALTPDQLTAIDRHLRKENWLLNEDLIAELTDHYANGIAEQVANGIPFELALIDIHKGFGGRKGLLKMEEEYHTTQAKVHIRLLRSILSSYFKMPRLGITVLSSLVLYGLNVMFPLSLKSDYVGFALATVALVTYFFAFRRLMYWHKSGFGRNAQVNLILQGFNALFLSFFYLRLFLPDKILLNLHPAVTTFICIVFFLYEVSTFELLMWYKTKRLKSVKS
ncbi:hypothetical protein [Larkinella sp. C7]|jgi:hypothetical protein|uniref:hypothetical protein n=1 Tax=Larkinella sp. C7 TaxID=2576607 RepID=UPI00111106EC|nr:hypothetical protein [Larkinella sp. C7]